MFNLRLKLKGCSMKKMTAFLLISSALLTPSAFSAQDNRAISYLTSWGVPEKAEKEITRSRIDTLLLSFGQWDANGNIQISDEMANIPTNSYWIPSSYLTWTQFKHDNPSRKIMVAFGGQNYESIWAYLTTPESREKIAQGLVNLLSKDFPVFKKLEGNGQYQKVASIQLDGIDFDFEKAARVTPEENANLLDLAKRVRQKTLALPSKKLLSLTTYHVGADPLECANPAISQNCSYVEPARSSHHGEVLPILEKGKNIFDFFNVMAYDAGKYFKFDVAMNNYARAVGNPAKIILGSTINAQWGPEGNFFESYQNNIERAAWQARNNFGGFFVWTLGANNHSISFVDQINYLNAMKEAANEATGHDNSVKPSAPTELKATVENGTISLSWHAPIGKDVVGYQIYRDGVNYSSASSTHWVEQSAQPNVEYRYLVKARDAAGNLSDASNEVVEKIQQSAEQIKPNTPVGLHVVSAAKNSLSIKWEPVTNVTIRHYHVWRDSVELRTVTDNQFLDSGLAAGKTYTYHIIAESDTGVMSLASSTLRVKTHNDPVIPEATESDWKVGVNYKRGDFVTYQGKKYVCLQSHMAMAHWNPGVAQSLWQTVP
ncbi:glycosyl hydrolase family 18 protein [Serratia symbiotica]|uniref:glycosyl hydrolase family 18 protein n=1 Tax=Serratia symbiotica TaxID=138074 RepID=UPI001CEFEB90|nr:glycosyl hydrolase family 18 protein [Serratia symbiotica]